MKLKKCVGIFLFSTLCLNVGAIDHKGITFDRLAPDRFTLMENGVANEILAVSYTHLRARDRQKSRMPSSA